MSEERCPGILGLRTRLPFDVYCPVMREKYRDQDVYHEAVQQSSMVWLDDALTRSLLAEGSAHVRHNMMIPTRVITTHKMDMCHESGGISGRPKNMIEEIAMKKTVPNV